MFLYYPILNVPTHLFKECLFYVKFQLDVFVYGSAFSTSVNTIFRILVIDWEINLNSILIQICHITPFLYRAMISVKMYFKTSFVRIGFFISSFTECCIMEQCRSTSIPCIILRIFYYIPLKHWFVR